MQCSWGKMALTLSAVEFSAKCWSRCSRAPCWEVCPGKAKWAWISQRGPEWAWPALTFNEVFYSDISRCSSEEHELGLLSAFIKYKMWVYEAGNSDKSQPSNQSSFCCFHSVVTITALSLHPSSCSFFAPTHISLFTVRVLIAWPQYRCQNIQ